MITEKGLAIIQHYESLHDGDLKKIGLQPKLDPIQIWTIGWGHALTDPITKRVLKGAKDKDRAYELFPNLTPELAHQWLINDTTEVCKQLDALLVKNKVEVNEDQFDALICFIYNVGLARFLKTTMWSKFTRKEENPEKELLKFVYANSNIMPGLRCRRQSELELFSTGKIVFYSYNKADNTIHPIV